MLFVRSVLLVLVALVLIVAARPKASPQVQAEIIVDEPSSYEEDDELMGPDSFPLAHDIPDVAGVDDYYIRK